MDQHDFTMRHESLRTQAMLQAAKLFCINCADGPTNELIVVKNLQIVNPP
jgi:hypothetical protein